MSHLLTFDAQKAAHAIARALVTGPIFCLARKPMRDFDRTAAEVKALATFESERAALVCQWLRMITAVAVNTEPAVITRRKVMRSRFATGPGPAWKWIYDVRHDGRDVVLGTDLLSIARRMGREASGVAAVESWVTP